MPNIYKRGETYWGRLQYKGKELRRTLETPSRSIAQERLNEWVAEVRQGKWKTTKGHAYEDARDKFVREHCRRIKAKSAKRYLTSLVALDKHFAGRSLEDISSATLSEYEDKRRAGGVSNATIRRDLSCLSAVFRCAEEWEWVLGNPIAAYMRKAQRRGLKESPPRTRYFSHDEQTSLEEAAKDRAATARHPRDQWAYAQLWKAIRFNVETGLRADELFALLWTDIDIDTKRVRVRAENSKTMKERSVPLSDEAMEIIDALPRRGRFVFAKRTGERYKDMYDRLKGLAKSLGIPDVRWHDLRRTCGCRLLQDKGIPLEHVSLWLGHSTVEQTRRAYAFLDVRHLEQQLQIAHARKKFH